MNWRAILAAKKFTIIRDSREKKGAGWKWNKSTWCNGSKVECLKTGDYAIAEAPLLIAIERKHGVSELCANFIGDRDRLDREMQRMLEFEHRYFIIECDLDDILNYHNYYFLPKKMRQSAPSTILGSLVSIGLRYGVHIIFAGDSGKEMASRILRKCYQYYIEGQNNES